MTKIKEISRKIGNTTYNTLIQTPFSIIKGLSWIHFLPSHVNYARLIEDENIGTRAVDPDIGSMPFYDINEEKLEKSPLKDHFYNRIFNLGRNLTRGESELEELFPAIPNFFVALTSGLGACTFYYQAYQQYGKKALLPLAITTLASLTHEKIFNNRLKGKDLENLV